MTSLVVLVLPSTMLPVTLHHVKHILVVLGFTVLRSVVARHLTLEGVTTMLHGHASAFEVLGRTILLLILALRVCAYLN